MKILFHVGVGNLDRPHRWGFVNTNFSNLARTFEKLGHECLVYAHPSAKINQPFYKTIQSSTVKPISFKPDWVFTWNGVSEGDQEIIKMFGRDKMIYGELGFFDHYRTLYFDFAGVNGQSENLVQNLSEFSPSIYKQILEKYHKLRTFSEPFIFVPLQDETDTQITKHSTFTKMQELIDYVCKMYIDLDIKILYKKHPKVDCKIIPGRNCIEVKDNIHHYLPYADAVIGINSTALLEALIYHNRVISLGPGISSRVLTGNEHKQYITHLANKQFLWADLTNIDKIKNSYFYKKMIVK
jgi:hypothetical protein